MEASADSFFPALMEDIGFCLRGLKDTTDPRERRALIRAGFAAVEGCVQLLKESILEDLHLNRRLYTPAEIAMLREESYAVDNRGNALTQQKFVPLDANIRFTIRMWCRGAVKEDVDLKGQGWEAFRSSLQLRNRLAHPKRASDLDVSDKELKRFGDGMMWMLRTLHGRLGAVIAAVEGRT